MCIVVTTNKRPHRHDIIDMTDKKDNLKKDRKSNLNHNATRKRYYYRQGRKLKPYFRDIITKGVTWNIDFRDMFEE